MTKKTRSVISDRIYIDLNKHCAFPDPNIKVS